MQDEPLIEFTPPAELPAFPAWSELPAWARPLYEELARSSRHADRAAAVGLYLCHARPMRRVYGEFAQNQAATEAYRSQMVINVAAVRREQLTWWAGYAGMDLASLSGADLVQLCEGRHLRYLAAVAAVWVAKEGIDGLEDLDDIFEGKENNPRVGESSPMLCDVFSFFPECWWGKL